MACGSGKYTNASFLCEACDSSCLNCTGPSANECTACQIDYGLVDNTCTICPNGTTSDGLNPCQNCTTPHCLACSDTDVCESCVSPYQIIDTNIGPQCAEACNVTDCSLCVNPGICSVCNTNYTLNGEGGCTLCAISNCTNCSSSNMCSSCENGLVPSTNSGSCVSCDSITVPNCNSCSMDNYCDECISEFLPIEGVCYLCGVMNCVNCNQVGNNYTCN